MMRRWVVIAIAAVLSMGAGAFASRAAAEPIARTLARAFGALAAVLPSPAPPAPQSSLPVLEAEPLDQDAEDNASPDPAPRSPALRRTTAARAAPRKGILVRRETVRAAVRAGVRPSGAPVGDTPDHPAGLQVYGLGAAGGLRDGDILTRVAGVTPRSVEDVIAAVAGCYKSKTYTISGEFWRDGERWNAVVELPEPKNKRE